MGNYKMKLIAISMIMILMTFTVSQTVDVFNEAWCGNSRVDVEIQTKDGDKAVVTKAKIVVPTALSRIQKTDFKELKLIPKNFQGLILHLSDSANEKHLGNIYNYDEDDKNSIFIPYLYLSAVEMVGEKFVITTERTFKDNNGSTFFIVPQPDSFDTNLCDCQRRMLKERIVQNFQKRKDILREIAQKMADQIAQIEITTKNLEDAKNRKIDRSKIIETEERIKKIRAQITALTEKIAKKNAEQVADKLLQQSLQKQLAALEAKIEKYHKAMRQYQYKLDHPRFGGSEKPKEIEKYAHRVSNMMTEYDRLSTLPNWAATTKSAFDSWQRVKGTGWNTKDYRAITEKFRIEYETLSTSISKHLTE